MHGLSRCRLQTCPPYRGAPAHPTAAFAWAQEFAFVRPCYLVITPLQELATFVLTMARPEASVRALRDVLRKNQKNKDLGDGWSAAGPGMGSRFRK